MPRASCLSVSLYLPYFGHNVMKVLLLPARLAAWLVDICSSSASASAGSWREGHGEKKIQNSPFLWLSWSNAKTRSMAQCQLCRAWCPVLLMILLGDFPIKDPCKCSGKLKPYNDPETGQLTFSSEPPSNNGITTLSLTLSDWCLLLRFSKLGSS